MCIILVKKAGVNMPKKSVLQNCWDNNPDGAGFMYATKHEPTTVRLEKGFMSFTALCDALYSIPAATAIDTTLVLHFRIATHGAVIPAMTHPFIIGANDEAVKSLSGVTNQAVAHNGVISGMVHKYLSDTQLFTQAILAAPEIRSNLHSPAVQSLIERFIGSSKLAILAPELILIGDFVEDNKILYSNTTYKTERCRFTYTPKTYDWKDYYTPRAGASVNIQCDYCADHFSYRDVTYYRDMEMYLCDECAAMVAPEGAK